MGNAASADGTLSPAEDEVTTLRPLSSPGWMPGTSRRKALQRRRSALFPPGFAHTFETFHDPDTSVTFQAGYDSMASWQPAKVLKYNVRAMFFSLAPWRAMRSVTNPATATKGLAFRVAGFSILALVFCLLTPLAAGDNSEQALKSLNDCITSGLFFILGPYVALSVSRWWTVRREGVGGLWGATDDLSMYACAWFHRKTIADRAARALIVRYGLLSLALLFKQARGEEDQLDDLVTSGLLLEREAAALQPLSSKPLVVWAWMSRFWSQALAGELATTPIVHAPQLAPIVMRRIADARGACGTALAFIDTQQPFPYVHLLAIMTDLALAVNAATCGLQAGRDLNDSDTQYHEVPLLLLTAWLRVAVVVVIFNGLLAVGSELDNPLGDDPADLPALAFQVWMKKECESFGAGVDAITDDAMSNSGDTEAWWEDVRKRA